METLARLGITRRDLPFRRVALTRIRAEKPPIRMSSNLARSEVIFLEALRMRPERLAAIPLKSFIPTALESANDRVCRSLLVCLRSRLFL